MRISYWSSDVCPSDLRLGGDEFAVIIERGGGQVDLAATGSAILSRLKEPVAYERRVLNASASLGGAVFPIDAASAGELFDNADIALYALKESGRGGTKMLEAHTRDRDQIVSSQPNLSRTTIRAESVEKTYQPKVN